MKLWRTRRLATVAIAAGLVSTVAVGAGPAADAAFPDTANPQVNLERTLTTEPFAGSTMSVKDHEGSAYVPRDHSLWLVDDNGRRIFEVNPVTGALKRTIKDADFTATPRFGGGEAAGYWRDRDLESIAYDGANDTLYVFSGSCCTESVLPTVYRLRRDAGGSFQLDSWQSLPAGTEFTGAAWSPADGSLYLGEGPELRSYDYVTNTLGAPFRVPNLARITGLQFSPSGADLYVSHALTKVSRVNWATKKLVAGWTFDLSAFGVMDARAVEVFDDRLWVSDGYDFRPDGDPLAHAVFVFSVSGPAPDPNLVGNPGFEEGTTGWNNNGTAGVTLERVAGGHSGAYAARLTNGNATASNLTLNDANPNWVATTAAGTYTATAWVRSDTGTGKASIRVREYTGATLVRSAASVVTLTSTWQQVSVSLSPQAPGSSHLDLQVYVSGAPAGTDLYVDDVAIVRQ